MAKPKKATPTVVIDALRKANGLQAGAARALRLSRTTISNYIKTDETIRAAYDDINEAQIDHVESKLFTEINKGNITAIIFYLKTKAKHRGYVETYKHEGGGENGAIELIIRKASDAATGSSHQ